MPPKTTSMFANLDLNNPSFNANKAVNSLAVPPLPSASVNDALAKTGGTTQSVSGFTPMQNESLFSFLGMDSRSQEDLMSNYAGKDMSKLRGTPEYTEVQQQMANDQKISNNTPGMLDNISTGLSAANTAFGIYDNIWGQAGEYRNAQIGALKDRQRVFNQEAQAKQKFRADTASAFA